MKKIFTMFSILLCCLCCAACSSGYSSIEEAEADGARLGECITIDLSLIHISEPTRPY